MAVPRLRVPTLNPGAQPRDPGGQLSDDVELYHRTYTTLLRSSGETLLRVLEPSHRSMHSSLHPLAESDELDLGAFLYATRRLPASIAHRRLIVMGQASEDFAANGVGPIGDWGVVEAPGRRRHWYDDGDSTLAVLLSSTSDLDDLIPTLVAYQIEWNKIRVRQRAAGWPPQERTPTAEECVEALGATADDWRRLEHAWGKQFGELLRRNADERLALRVRMLGGSEIGYSRATRRWWAPVASLLESEGLAERPLYFVSSNTHSLSNLVTGLARAHEDELVGFVEASGPDYLRDELQALRAGRSEGDWNNFLYYAARLWFEGDPAAHGRRAAEREAGVTHIPSATALRLAAQVMPLDRLDPARLDERLGEVDPDRLAASDAVIVNIDYPLGLAAYNTLREIAQASGTPRGVYILGKAATLNADVGDVMISSVVHDEHSGSTYWLDNAFTVDDIAPYLRFGSGLDNQRAVTVKSTFLQNREYLDFYYREAFTVVEMEAGPYCDAVYELSDVERYPVGEAVNFSKLPVDFGVIHYASDTPYTQARTLGARGLSYFGMDSTYAASIAIMRRVLRLEGALVETGARGRAPLTVS